VRVVRRNGYLALLFGALLFAPLAPAHATPSTVAASGQMMDEPPIGRWMTPTHDAVIQIAPCGTELCGQIVGMVLQPTDPVPRDWTGASLCGLTIIHAAAEREGDGRVVWRGSIINPHDGAAYHAQLTVGADHRLHLRGYVALPVFGLTQRWTAYNGPDATVDCRLSPTPRPMMTSASS
jgi:uncharacterized protein (DUF2147 family)